MTVTRRSSFLIAFLAPLMLSTLRAPSVEAFCRPCSTGRRIRRPASLFSSSTSSSEREPIASSSFTTTRGPDPATKPDYENIVGPLGRLMDDVFLRVFRQALAKQVGVDSTLPQGDYHGIIELAALMNQRCSNRAEIQNKAQLVLRSLFPSWMPGSYAKLFSQPFPAFSSRMNAWATRVAGTWLMGECEINDVEEVDGGGLGKDQGLLVKRCRFLEESGCASVCVNSCKLPTQNFFLQDMGLPLTMEPDYDTFECQFSFGKTPTEATEAEAKNTPCLSRCPTAGSLRQWHDGTATAGAKVVSNCALIDGEE